MKFLHAADLHIDSPLGGLAVYEGAPVGEIRGATRRATENLVDTAIENEVDLVVLAGDIFDGDWRDYGTGLFWIGQLARLNDAAIPVVLTAGNHDAASEISRRLRLPPNVTQLATAKPETKVFDHLDVAVIGQGYATKSVKNNLTQEFPTGEPSLFTIGLLHTSLDGRPGHANYAPCTLDSLRSRGYQYWALGHVHQREEVLTDPWIVFSGNIQGRHARETGAKGAMLVSVESNEVQSVQHVTLDEVRWHHCVVDAAGLTSVDDVLAAVAESLREVADDSGHRLSAVRVRIVGRSPSHAALWRDPAGFEQEVRALSVQMGNVWVERVKLDTKREADLNLLGEDDFFGAMAATVDALRSGERSLASFAASFADLRSKIISDARSAEFGAVDTASIGTEQHVADNLAASLELLVGLLAGDSQ